MKFFSKSAKKAEDDEYNSQSEPSSPVKSPTKPPAKAPPKSSAASSSSQRPAPRPESPSLRDAKARPSRSFARQPTDPGSRRKKIDPDTHPLNLPPEQRKRFSAMSANNINNRSSMDIDREPPSGTPSSPPPQQPASQATPSSSASKMPAAAAANGVPSPMNIDSDVPVPPPHRSQPSSPTPSPLEEAEAYKAAGNRFFKEKDYKRAIEEYSKGEPLNRSPVSDTHPD